MAWEIIMPKMGMGMTEGKVVRWHVADGAAVTAGQLICEVESDKIVAELNAELDGVLSILAPEDSDVAVGHVIGSIEPAEGAVLPERRAATDEAAPRLVDAGGVALNVQLLGEGGAAGNAGGGDGVGSGDAVIFLHGLGSSMGLWGALDMARLGPRRVVVYDLRGHGASDKPPGAHTLGKHAGDLLALMDALEIPQADLVGHSLGGMVALHTAAAQGARVRRVAALACTAALTPALRERFFELATDASFGGMKAVADAMLALSFAPAFAKANPKMMAAMRGGLLAGDAGSFTAATRLVAKVDLAPVLANIACPVLVVAADEDAIMPAEAVGALGGAIPGARLVTLSGCGHGLPLEQPTALAQVLADFLE